MATNNTENLQIAIDYIDEFKGFDFNIRSWLKLIYSKSNGECEFKFKVENHHLNDKGFLSEKLYSLLIDVVGSLSIVAYGVAVVTVTSDLTTTYISQAKLSDEITIIGNTVDKNKKLVFAEVQLINSNTKKLIGKGCLTKIIVPTKL